MCWSWLPRRQQWSAQEIPIPSSAPTTTPTKNGWSWMDLTSDGSVQLGVQDKQPHLSGRCRVSGRVVPEGVVLGISAAETELGFVAAFKNDLYNEIP
ncbi:MAG: hypothetical protein ACLT9S_00085 [Faecalibacterium sp.]